MKREVFMKYFGRPESKTGKWSVGFAFVALASLAISVVVGLAIGGSSEKIASVIAANSVLRVFVMFLSLSLNLAGLLSLILGVFACVRYRDWSVAKYLAVIFGAALLLFLVGEFTFPH